MKLKFIGVCDMCGDEVRLVYLSTKEEMEETVINVDVKQCECYKEDYKLKE